MISTRYQAIEALLQTDVYSDQGKTELLGYCYDQWSDYEDGEAQLASDLAQFATKAIDQVVDNDWNGATPVRNAPEEILILGVLTAVSVRDMDVFSETPPRNIRPYNAVLDFTTENICRALLSSESKDLLQDIAELVFKQAGDEDRIFPGRICEGFESDIGQGDSNTYCKVSLPAASNLLYEKQELSDMYTETAPKAIINNNTLYIPFGRFTELLRTRLRESVEIYAEHEYDTLEDNELLWTANNTEQLQETITKWRESRNLELLYESYDKEEEKLNVIEAAIAEAPDDVAVLGTPLTASEIIDALDLYDPSEHEKQLVSSLFSPHNIASLFNSEADRPQVDVHHRNNDADLYELRPSGHGSAKQLTVTHIEDLLELPCFNAMFQYMEDHGPVHEELLNFVGTAKWLDIYYNDEEKYLNDVKELFSNHSWYDEQTTEYQVQDERKRRDKEGSPYYPKKCRNEDMQKWCVGLSVCPYSIYSSLPFANELYDGLSDNED